MRSMPKILFIGDIVGKPGRKILSQVLPGWKEKYQPDVVIANVENLAHGKGVTASTLAEVDALGIDCFTSGNHIYDKEEQVRECFEKYPKLIRPGNISGSAEGYGFYRFSKGGQQYLVLNLHGQVFCDRVFDGRLSNPFLAVDELLARESQKGDIIFIDFHAEATSEKKVFGHYVDGRVSAVVGTHTHVPTADAHIMPNGTGYVTDVGMAGSRDSALGVKFENALKKFLDPNAKFVNEMEEQGVMQINGVLIEIDAPPTGGQKSTKIEKLYEEIK